MTPSKTTKPPEWSSFVADDDSGERLDRFLAAHVPSISRRRARHLIDAGSVFVDERRVRVSSRRVASGQRVRCSLPELALADREALDPSLVLHRDEDLVAIAKPAGMPCHPTRAMQLGSALQLVEERLRLDAGRKVAVWPLHRLDTGTSGVLLFATTRDAARTINAAFAARTVAKTYRALVSGVLDPRDGEIADALVEGHLVSTVGVSGREAATRYRTLRVDGARSLLELEPATGRMHQIRVHLAHRGHPVVGDAKYGGEAADRLHLHAARIDVPHPRGGRLVVEAPPPLGSLLVYDVGRAP